MAVVFDPERHCGAKGRRCTTDPPTCVHRDGVHACRLAKGAGTDHQGAGHCRYHLGNSENGKKGAQRESRFTNVLAGLAGLTLSQIADKLARVAAAGALASTADDHEDFARAVNAFAKAAERAEGNKLTIDARVDFLSRIPDTELEAAIAETERLIAERRRQTADA